MFIFNELLIEFFISIYLILLTNQIDQDKSSQSKFSYPIVNIKDLNYSEMISNDGVFTIYLDKKPYFINFYDSEKDDIRIKNYSIYDNVGNHIKSDVLFKANTVSTIRKIRTVGVVYDNNGFKIILLKNIELYDESKYKFDFLLKEFSYKDNVVTEVNSFIIKSDYLDNMNLQGTTMIIFDNFKYLYKNNSILLILGMVKINKLKRNDEEVKYHKYFNIIEKDEKLENYTLSKFHEWEVKIEGAHYKKSYHSFINNNNIEGYPNCEVIWEETDKYSTKINILSITDNKIDENSFNNNDKFRTIIPNKDFGIIYSSKIINIKKDLNVKSIMQSPIFGNYAFYQNENVNQEFIQLLPIDNGDSQISEKYFQPVLLKGFAAGKRTYLYHSTELLLDGYFVLFYFTKAYNGESNDDLGYFTFAIFSPDGNLIGEEQIIIKVKFSLFAANFDFKYDGNNNIIVILHDNINKKNYAKLITVDSNIFFSKKSRLFQKVLTLLTVIVIVVIIYCWITKYLRNKSDSINFQYETSKSTIETEKV